MESLPPTIDVVALFSLAVKLELSMFDSAHAY
jgi:hypothetical protein